MKTTLRILVPLLILTAVFVFFGVLPRIRNQQELRAAADDEATRTPLVKVVTLQRLTDSTGLTLPGQIVPYRETPVFARTQGFLRKRYVDLGARVSQGQLLAMIEAPELDQDIARARADLKLAQANLDRLKSVTLPGAVAQQDLDSRAAAVETGEANLRRLTALKELQEVRAPFAGTITARNAEIGNLIGTTGGTPLFTISQTDLLRVFIDVPQAYYQLIQTGQEATVRVPELRNRAFRGQVVRTSGTLRAQSRTLLTEIAIPNRDGQLAAGLYAQVVLDLKPTDGPITIPANTLLIRPEGPQVVLVQPEGKVHFQPVSIGRDHGTTLEITEGLAGTERLVINPNDRLKEGTLVRVK
jgi:membrane fusion protein (multidrug efflux system)